MRTTRWALVPLRIVIGIGFVVHGYAKLAHGPSHFAAIVGALDLPAPLLLAWATTIVELAGGLALMAGAFVVPVAIALTGVMATAIFGVHLPYGFSSVRLLELTDAGARFGPVGYELPLVYIVSLVALAASEPSPGSIDAWRARPRR